MITAEDLISKYIKFRDNRFPASDKWMCGNCYQYACIVSGWLDLQEMSYKVYYDTVLGHFVVGVPMDGIILLFDWSGVVCVDISMMKSMVDWDSYKEVDSLHYERIVRDCCL